MNIEQWIVKYVEGSGYGLVWGDILEYIWVKPRKTVLSLAEAEV